MSNFLGFIQLPSVSFFIRIYQAHYTHYVHTYVCVVAAIHVGDALILLAAAWVQLVHGRKHVYNLYLYLFHSISFTLRSYSRYEYRECCCCKFRIFVSFSNNFQTCFSVSEISSHEIGEYALIGWIVFVVFSCFFFIVCYNFWITSASHSIGL